MSKYAFAMSVLVFWALVLLAWHLGCLGRRAYRRHRGGDKMLRSFEGMCAKEVSEACQRSGINFTPGVLRRFAWQNPYLVGRMFGTLFSMIDQPCLPGWSWGIEKDKFVFVDFFTQEFRALPFLARRHFNAQDFALGLKSGGFEISRNEVLLHLVEVVFGAKPK